MPKSEPPRKKASATPRSKSNRRMADIINQAMALDRRRQAQIENQRRSITRLLNSGIDYKGDTTTPEARYTEEMKILHEGAAALGVQLEDTQKMLEYLIAAIEHDFPHERLQQLAVVLPQARALVGLSAPVSDAEGEAG